VIALSIGVAAPEGLQQEGLATYLGEGTSQRASASADALSILPQNINAKNAENAKRKATASQPIYGYSVAA